MPLPWLWVHLCRSVRLEGDPFPFQSRLRSIYPCDPLLSNRLILAFLWGCMFQFPWSTKFRKGPTLILLCCLLTVQPLFWQGWRRVQSSFHIWKGGKMVTDNAPSAQQQTIDTSETLMKEEALGHISASFVVQPFSHLQCFQIWVSSKEWTPKYLPSYPSFVVSRRGIYQCFHT